MFSSASDGRYIGSMNKNEKIVVLMDGFAKTEAQSALSSYADAGGDSSVVIAAPITDITANRITGDVVEAVAAGEWPGGKPRTGGKRSALIAGAGKREAVALMRCFKGILPKDADAAFAMVTETGAAWTVDEYISHIRKEHDYMKTADVASDPDMKEI